jgi:hypothetical protein
VALLGFDGEDDARRAARAAFRALCRWRARQARAAGITECRRALAARRDGDVVRLVLGGVPVGRLIAPGDPAAHDATSWGFELLLPPSLDPALALGAARVLAAALDRRAAALRLESATAAA